MIQRIQTLYLLLALAAIVACQFLPIGRFVEEGNVVSKMYNLSVLSYKGTRSFTPWALCAILTIIGINSLFTILLFRKRMRQVRLCIFNVLLLIGYWIAYATFAFMLKTKIAIETTSGNISFRPEWAAALPLVALLLTYLAWRNIMKDELLVRSLDRLR